MIGLITDTGNNIPDIIQSRFQIKIVPLLIILDKQEYRDGLEIEQQTIIEYMTHHFPKTSLPHMEDIRNAFLECIQKGQKEIIAINLSSALSGTYNSFCLVAQKIRKQYPDVKIAVIDSCRVSIGTGLLTYKAAQLIDQGLPFDEIVKRIYETIPRIQIFFIVPTLKFLIHGGRLGKVSGTIGEWLRVKPILSMNDEGHLYAVAKAPGFSFATKEMVKQVKKFIGDKELDVLGLYHCGESEETKKVVSLVKNDIQRLSPPELYYGAISSTILVHGGPGVVGVGVLLKP